MSALTVSVAHCGAVTVDLLRRLLGLLTESFVYRREAGRTVTIRNFSEIIWYALTPIRQN